VVLVGDAELDEGSNHEAIELAGALGLDGLTVVVVDNRSSTYNRPGLIERRFANEAWHTVTADGRDHAVLQDALQARHPARPNVVIAEVEESS
nr:transketolase [Nocardioidaceae bacterium]